MDRMSWWRKISQRSPDFVVGHDGDDYLHRWYVIPRNKILNIYLHRFLRSDQDEQLHDHPWLFNASVMLDGEYVEETVANGGVHHKVLRKAGQWKLRFGPAPHRVELPSGDCWTLFVTGPVYRTWGFHCKNGWRDFKTFLSTGRGTGAGCN